MTTPNLPRGPCWVEQQDSKTFKVFQIFFEGKTLNFANFFEEAPKEASFQIDFQDWKEFAPANWNPDFLIVYAIGDKAHIIGLSEEGNLLRNQLLSL